MILIQNIWSNIKKDPLVTVLFIFQIAVEKLKIVILST